MSDTTSVFLDHFDQVGKLPKIDKYMMATKAIHKLGDISRDTPDLCRVLFESETDYYGSWITGFGFFHVQFPKDTTRELTPEEIEKYNNMYVGISGQPAFKLNVA